MTGPNGGAAPADALLREVARRVAELEVPAAGYDPLGTCGVEPDRYLLPQRRNPESEPEEYRLCQGLFTPPAKGTLNFIRPEFDFDVSYRLDMSNQPTGSARIESSPNWSGAYVVPSHGRRFNRIAASWRVPKVNPPKPADGGDPAPGDYRSSTWIGLDGHRRYTNGMPQMGTAQFVKVADDGCVTRDYHLWWQWWARGQMNPPVRISNMPIEAGQMVSCQLTVQRPDRVLLHVRNQDTGDFATLLIDAPDPTRCAPDPVVLGTSAEWITERPTRLKSEELYPLPDFREAVFEDCQAWSSEAPGCTEVRQTLEAARLIRIYERQDKTRRATFLSLPKRPPGSTQLVRTIYRGHQLWPE